jgi:hypothetical protein
MEVLKHGRKQRGWAGEFDCTGAGNGLGGCGARLLVDQHDLFQTTRGYYDGSTDYYKTFECPECGVHTDVEAPCEPLGIHPKNRNDGAC